MCGNFWTWIHVQGRIFPQNCCISPHNQPDLEQVSVEDSVAHVLMQKWTVTSREFLPPAATAEFLICRLRCSLFMETPMEDLCQESMSRRTQSDECGTVLTLLLRFLGWSASLSPLLSAFCCIQFTPTAVKSMLSCYHVSYMDCVTVRLRERRLTPANLNMTTNECNSAPCVLLTIVLNVQPYCTFFKHYAPLMYFFGPVAILLINKHTLCLHQGGLFLSPSSLLSYCKASWI